MALRLKYAGIDAELEVERDLAASLDAAVAAGNGGAALRPPHLHGAAGAARAARAPRAWRGAGMSDHVFGYGSLVLDGARGPRDASGPPARLGRGDRQRPPHPRLQEVPVAGRTARGPTSTWHSWTSSRIRAASVKGLVQAAGGRRAGAARRARAKLRSDRRDRSDRDRLRRPRVDLPRLGRGARAPAPGPAEGRAVISQRLPGEGAAGPASRWERPPPEHRPAGLGPGAGGPVIAAWHDVECASYGADLPLWRELAEERGVPGAGRGRRHRPRGAGPGRPRARGCGHRRRPRAGRRVRRAGPRARAARARPRGRRALVRPRHPVPAGDPADAGGAAAWRAPPDGRPCSPPCAPTWSRAGCWPWRWRTPSAAFPPESSCPRFRTCSRSTAGCSPPPPSTCATRPSTCPWTATARRCRPRGT